MNSQEIKEFLKTIKHTDIEEIEYHNNDDYLYFKKSETGIVAAPVVSVKKDVVKSKKSEEKDFVVSIKSTMVGIFVIPPDGGVKEGDNITIGQKVGQVEAMKIVKDIKTEVKGKIVKVLVSNSQLIEYGQELFLVDISK